eukprot:ANDGO_03391.mRNA.1 hypothetical protein
MEQTPQQFPKIDPNIWKTRRKGNFLIGGLAALVALGTFAWSFVALKQDDLGEVPGTRSSGKKISTEAAK